MKYLIDTSALIRILRREADPTWDDLVGRGLVSVCEPALVETLKIAETKRYAEMEDYIAEQCPSVTVPDAVWDLVAALRRSAAAGGAHRAFSVADLVIAATAIRLKLTVLHEDSDFVTAARFMPQLREHRLSAGPQAN